MSAVRKAGHAELAKNLKHAKAGGWKRVENEIAAELQYRADKREALTVLADRKGGLIMATDPMTARAEMRLHRAHVMAEHPEVQTAAELAPLMGEHATEYWNWCLERVQAISSATPENRCTRLNGDGWRCKSKRDHFPGHAFANSFDLRDLPAKEASE